MRCFRPALRRRGTGSAHSAFSGATPTSPGFCVMTRTGWTSSMPRSLFRSMLPLLPGTASAGRSEPILPKITEVFSIPSGRTAIRRSSFPILRSAGMSGRRTGASFTTESRSGNRSCRSGSRGKRRRLSANGRSSGLSENGKNRLPLQRMFPVTRDSAPEVISPGWRTRGSRRRRGSAKRTRRLHTWSGGSRF